MLANAKMETIEVRLCHNRIKIEEQQTSYFFDIMIITKFSKKAIKRKE